MEKELIGSLLKTVIDLDPKQECIKIEADTYFNGFNITFNGILIAVRIFLGSVAISYKDNTEFCLVKEFEDTILKIILNT